MKIPSSFNEMTVGQFMDWHRISKETPEVSPEDIELGITPAHIKEYRLLASLLGITPEQCQDIPTKILKPLFQKSKLLAASKPNEKPKRIILVNKKPYVAVVNPKDFRELLSANQYICFKEYTKEDAIQNMDKLLALLYTPYRLFRKPKLSQTPDQTAKEFRNALIGDVYGFVFFLGKQYQELMSASQPFLKQAMKTIQEQMEEIRKAQGQDSKQGTGGITS